MKFTGLIALQAISNLAQLGELPKKIKLLNWGDNPSLKGNIKVGPKTLASLSSNQKLFGFDKVGIDYEHQSLEGHKNFKPSPREYAGYGNPVVIEGDGLYVDAIAYTPSGEKNALNYHDLSPVVYQDENGEVTFLHSVALCPQGAVENLSFYNATFQLDAMKLTAMNPDLKKLLCTLFGAPETADEAAILTAGQAFVEKLASSSKKPEGEQKDYSSDIQAIMKRLDDQERENILAAALRDGKLVPNSAKDLPLDKLKSLVAELEAGAVPLEKRTPGEVKALSTSLTASDLAVASQLGIKPEDFAK